MSEWSEMPKKKSRALANAQKKRTATKKAAEGSKAPDALELRTQPHDDLAWESLNPSIEERTGWGEQFNSLLVVLPVVVVAFWLLPFGCCPLVVALALALGLARALGSGSGSGSVSLLGVCVSCSQLAIGVFGH